MDLVLMVALSAGNKSLSNRMVCPLVSFAGFSSSGNSAGAVFFTTGVSTFVVLEPGEEGFVVSFLGVFSAIGLSIVQGTGKNIRCIVQ